MINRIIKYTVLILILSIFQTVFFGQFLFLRVKPDLLLVLIIAVAFFSDGPEGLYIGLACGVFRDLAMTDTFGFYTILSVLAAAVTGMFNKRIFKDNVFLFSMIVLGISAAYEIASCILNMIHDFISGSSPMSLYGYLYYIRDYSVMTVIMNFLVSLVMFYLIKLMFFRKSLGMKEFA